MAFLIDTCVWIDVERGLLAPGDVAGLTGNEAVYLSPITIAELKFGADTAATASIRSQRLSALARLKRKPLLPIDGETGEIFGMLAAELQASGRAPRHRVQDLWLASQAIQHSYSMVTRNQKDFADIPGLNLITYSLRRRGVSE